MGSRLFFTSDSYYAQGIEFPLASLQDLVLVIWPLLSVLVTVSEFPFAPVAVVVRWPLTWPLALLGIDALLWIEPFSPEISDEPE